MKYSNTPIFQTVYLITIEIYKSSANFPKEFKYSLGEKMKSACHDMIELVMHANFSDKKIELIRKIDLKLEILRIYLRLAYDLRAVNAGQLENINKRIQEAGKQIGGWQKWAIKNINNRDR